MSVTVSNNGLMPANMDQAMRLSDMMAKGKLMPAHLRDQPGDCLMVIEQAMRWGMSPFAVAQSTSVISGKLMFEGKLVAAALHGSGALKGRLSYVFSGEGDARKVIASGVLQGETEPRTVEIALRDVRTTNKMWQTQPDQQLVYSGARVWARRHCPEVMLGVYSPEEMETEAPIYTGGPTIVAEATPVVDDRDAKVNVWLDQLAADLDSAMTADEVIAIEARPAVRKAKDRLTGSHAERLDAMLNVALAAHMTDAEEIV
jgi:hypothetical protein